ncbi:MAG: DUF362 domain-containing protein [Thermoplasmatota archaeon]
MDTCVHVTRCREYDPDIIRPQIKEHLDRYPKFKDLKGKKVLLKPNLLSASDPGRAVTTHPAFLKAVVLELKDRGANVIIADSPGGAFTEPALKKLYNGAEISEVARETGAQLNFNVGSHEVKHPKGMFTKNFLVCDYLKDADLIIALPKIKTHMLCGLTCASKVMFGIVPGTEKVMYHTRFPDSLDFSKVLLDLDDMAGTDLFLVDGIIGMDGKGPAQGRPREVGTILSGTNHLAIDLHVCRMVGLEPDDTTIFQAAFEQKRIKKDESLAVSGDGSDFRLKERFKPSSGGIGNLLVPRPIRRTLINLTTSKPKISHNKCVGCGVCKHNCAGNAIEIKNKKARITYSRCIRCYCCHELCPHDAVYVNFRDTGVLNRLIDIGYQLFTG